MGIEALGGTYGLYGTQAKSDNDSIKSRKSGADMDINDFFTLLCAQLQNQSMDNPVDDTQFIAQMAQFSSLQQMTELTNQYKYTFAASMMGKNVTVEHTGDDGLSKKITGQVDKVSLIDGKAYISINGTKYDSSEVIEISESK